MSWQDAPIIEGNWWDAAPLADAPEVSTTEKQPVTSKAAEAAGRLDKGTLAMAKFAQGLPFVGEYVDEAFDFLLPPTESKPGGGEILRQAQDQIEESNPGLSTAAEVAGGITGSIPLAAAALPGLAARAPATLGAKALAAGGVGAVAGGVEGAVSGFGEQEGGRGANAAQRGTIGAVAGGVLGSAAPYAAEGITRVVSSLKGSDIAIIANTLGITKAAAKVVRSALDRDDINAAMAQLNRAGDDAVLADAGQAGRELLDASANAGGRAGAIARDAVDARVNTASRKMTATLDRTLGKPSGKDTIKEGVRADTAAARQTAYDEAYSKPIDYSASAGRSLEALMSRIPNSAIKTANKLMKLEGNDSQQIIARIADNGRVQFDKLPDVRQLDYITRALNEVAEKADGKGKLGGTTATGNATKALSRSIRQALKRAVPEYGKALDVAADAISRTQASDMGYAMLRASTTRENVYKALSGASKAELEAAKQGLRTYIDDTLANVSRTVTDPNTDAREGIKLLREFSSRANQSKLQRLLGKSAAKKLTKELDQAAVSFELRAAIAQNSKTAIRQGIQGQVDGISSPGVLETLGQGEPINAVKRLTQLFTGATDEAIELRQMGVYEDIARALTEKKGPQARKALKMVNAAIDRQKIGETAANRVASAIVATGVLSGSREASKRLSTQ